MLFSPFGLLSLPASHPALAAGFEADIPEAEICSDLRVVSGGVTLGDTHMSVPVNCAKSFVAHQVLHLTNREILDVFLLRTRFLDFRLAADPLVFVCGIENSFFSYAHAPP